LKALLILFLALSSTLAVGQSSNKLRAYVDSKQFYAPQIGNYIEVYVQFSGTSVRYLGVENGLQGEVALKYEITKNDEVIQADAYRLSSPVMLDSIVEDFYDVKRFALTPGSYTMKMELLDLNSQSDAIKATFPITIEEFSDGITISDIQVAETIFRGGEESVFSKSGLTIIPRLATFYPTELSVIPVYFELYNTNQTEEDYCGLKQMITNEKGEEMAAFTVFTRHETSEILPIVKKVDIATLPSGKYNLSYTLLSKSLTELSTQTYEFERSNDAEIFVTSETIILDPKFQSSIADDSVYFYLASLIPISRTAEVKNIISTLKSKDKEKMRKHLQAFWLQTAPQNTYDAWIKYKLQVQLVERLYSNNFQVGYETDRGRVYLQYGAPTTIVDKENSPTEYPYEIWQYNKIGSFSNKRFVFYNPDLVNNTYTLLHSDMLGELKNPGWPQILSKRNTSRGNVDDPNLFNQQHFGGGSNDLFRQY
jgi:GWxTD domain-containing protein